MKVNVQDINAARKRLEIIVPAKEVASFIEDQMTRSIKQAKVKGFRPGKAPKQIFERQYGAAVKNQAVSEMMEKHARKAIEDQDLHPIAITAMEPGRIEEKKDFTFFAEIEVMPDIKLGKYTGVEVVRPTAVVSDEDVDRAINEMRQRGAVLKKPEPARPVAKGDVVTIDFEAKSEGKKLTNESNFQLELGVGTMPENFEQEMIGLNEGDKKNIVVIYPEEWKHQLSGKEVEFAVEVKVVQEKSLPTLDDEFAKDVGAESLEDLKKKLRDKIVETRQQIIDQKSHEDIIHELIKATPVDVPPSLVEHQKQTMREDIKRQFTQAGIPMKGLNQYEEVIHDRAVKKVHGDLLLKAIAEAEKIEASDEDFNKKVHDLSHQMGQDHEKFKDHIESKGLSGVLKAEIRDALTLDFLLKNAILIEKKKDEKPTESEDSPKPKKASKKSSSSKKKEE